MHTSLNIQWNSIREVIKFSAPKILSKWREKIAKSDFKK